MNTQTNGQLQSANFERRQRMEALQGLIEATRWIADQKLSDILRVIAFFNTQHTCYLETTTGQEDGSGGQNAFAYQIMANLLVDMASFRNQWPDVDLDELKRFSEVFDV